MNGITLISVEPLFAEEAPVPKDTFKQQALDDFKSGNLAGVPDQKLEINFNPEDGSDIIVKLIDPHAAAGYLVFQDESAYSNWLSAQLYEPSQDEIMEAAQHG